MDFLRNFFSKDRQDSNPQLDTTASLRPPEMNLQAGISEEHRETIDWAKNQKVSPFSNSWTLKESFVHGVPYFVGGKLLKIPGMINIYNSEKSQYVADFQQIIKDASQKESIPEYLLAGVAFKEFAGDPHEIDFAAFGARWLTQLIPDEDVKSMLPGMFSTSPDKTTFGDTSVQIRTAAETLGYDPGNLEFFQRLAIIKSLTNRTQAISISAQYLKSLKESRFGKIASSEMTDLQIAEVASMYNGGPSVKGINPYGQEILDKKDLIIESLNGDSSFVERLLRALGSAFL